jgi:hypothetical protein
MRIAVTGGRDYAQVMTVFETLDILHREYPDFTLVVGDAKGADAHARTWATKKNVRHEVYYADWKAYPKAAGPIRNKQMLDSGVDILVAFPGGNGTANMTGLCKKAGVQILVIED